MFKDQKREYIKKKEKEKEVGYETLLGKKRMEICFPRRIKTQTKTFCSQETMPGRRQIGALHT